LIRTRTKARARICITRLNSELLTTEKKEKENKKRRKKNEKEKYLVM